MGLVGMGGRRGGVRADKGIAHRWGMGGRGRGSQLEAAGFQEHTRGQWLWS